MKKPSVHDGRVNLELRIDDAPDAGELTSRAAEHAAKMEEGVDWCQAAAKETQNPIYAWMAIQYRIWAQPIPKAGDTRFPDDELVIPGWCAEYLEVATENLICLSENTDFRKLPQYQKRGEPVREIVPITPKIALTLVAEALGLSRRGFNAFKNRRADDDAIAASSKVEQVRHNGVSSEKAMEAVSMLFPDHESSVFRKLVTRGRRLRFGRPKRAKPPT